jgi:hypothetical protein
LALTCGDGNCDSNVNMVDVSAAWFHWQDIHTAYSPWAADVNHDNDVDMVDVSLIRNHWQDPDGYPMSCCDC